MSRRRLLVERGEDGDVLSVPGLQDLFRELLDGRPEIRAVVVEVDEDCSVPDAYDAVELDGSGALAPADDGGERSD